MIVYYLCKNLTGGFMFRVSIIMVAITFLLGLELLSLILLIASSAMLILQDNVDDLPTKLKKKVEALWNR